MDYLERIDSNSFSFVDDIHGKRVGGVRECLAFSNKHKSWHWLVGNEIILERTKLLLKRREQRTFLLLKTDMGDINWRDVTMTNDVFTIMVFAIL